MRNADLAFAGFILIAALLYVGMALWMPQGSLKFPGPGFYPKLVGVFFVATAVGCLVQAAVTRPAPGPAAPKSASRSTATKTALLLGLLVGYGLLLKPAGFPVAVCLFLMAAIRVFGYRRWLIAAVIAVGLTIISYVTFIIWLKVPLPLGLLDDLLD